MSSEMRERLLDDVMTYYLGDLMPFLPSQEQLSLHYAPHPAENSILTASKRLYGYGAPRVSRSSDLDVRQRRFGSVRCKNSFNIIK